MFCHEWVIKSQLMFVT